MMATRSPCLDGGHHLLLAVLLAWGLAPDAAQSCGRNQEITVAHGRKNSHPMCDDGKYVTGHYCGVGPCDVFGNNCDGGCIRGRRFVVPSVRPGHPLLFYCDASVPADLGDDVEALVRHRDCSCLSRYINKNFEYTMPDPPVVELPEVDMSEPLYCSEGNDECGTEIKRAKVFTVTSSVTYSGGLSRVVPKIAVPAELGLAYTMQWSEATGTEISHHCNVKPGRVVRLRVKPLYYNVTIIERDMRVVGGRHYCNIRNIYLPKKADDGSIAGERRCASSPKKP